MSALRALTADEAQQLFRACMDALARPGRIVPIDTTALPEGRHTALLPLLALTDLMAPVATLDHDETELRELAIVTGAPVTPLSQARWVLATGRSVQRYRELNPGIALRPEHGAMVCQQVDALGTGDAFELSGPGVDGATTLRVSGLPEGFVQSRDELVDTPPCGVDFLLVAPTAIAAVPRTTAMTLATAEARS